MSVALFTKHRGFAAFFLAFLTMYKPVLTLALTCWDPLDREIEPASVLPVMEPTGCPKM